MIGFRKKVGDHLIEYKIVEFPVTSPRDAAPFEGRWPMWVLYAGKDGSIIAYKPKSNEWERLRQTRTNDYWGVSVPSCVERRSRSNRKGDEPKPEIYSVHELVLQAWKGDRPSKSHHGCHNNGDNNDNTESNLSWEKRRINAEQAVSHKSKRDEKRLKKSGMKILLECHQGMWTLKKAFGGQLIASVPRKSAVGLLKKALDDSLPLANRTPAKYDCYLPLIARPVIADLISHRKYPGCGPTRIPVLFRMPGE